MKKTGKFFLTIYLFLSFPLTLFSSEVETTLTNNKISVGETTTISFKISGGDSEVTPLKIPKVSGLDFSYSGIQSSFQFINGRTWKGVILTYTILAEKKGKYTIPPFTFDLNNRKINSSPVTLLVTKAAAGSKISSSNRRQVGYLKSFLSFNKENFYLGEPIIMRYYLLSSGLKGIRLEGIEKSPKIEGFVVKEIEESIEEGIVTVDGIEYIKSHLYTFVLVSAETGQHQVGGGSIIISYNVNRGFFSRSSKKRIIYDTKNIEIIPLPEEGQPSNFAGDVGIFSLQANFNSKEVNVFEEKRIPVTIKGEGNFLSITKPIFNNSKEVKILIEDGKSQYSLQGNKITGYKKYTCTVIAEKDGLIDLGPIQFKYFNPQTKEYSTAQSAPISFKAKGKPQKKTKKINFEKPTSQKLSFNLIYLIIILAFITGGVILIVIWERKRYALLNQEKTKEQKNKRPEITKTEINPLKELENYWQKKNYRSFLALAEKIMNTIKTKVSQEEQTKINRSISQIQSYRFGGEQITDKNMKEIYDFIKNLDGNL